MRPVNGFQRPGFQWLFVALGVVLVVVAAAEGITLRRMRADGATLRAAELNTRIELDRVRALLAREQASREALTLELTRQRSRGDGINQPTLTLSPLTTRAAQPPDPTVTKPADQQSIQLRLVLPSVAEPRDARYSIAIRRWSSGETVWSRSGLRMTPLEKGPMVTAFITGDVLAPGAYEIALSRLGAEGAVEVAGYEVSIR